jgi:tetratricopeptide (TPR) repeat protein
MIHICAQRVRRWARLPASRRRVAAGGIALLVALGLQPSTSPAYGGLDNYQLTPEEVALLPEFCRHTQLIVPRHGSDAAQKEWIARVGPSFLHMHHYCIAVVAYVRSFRHANRPADRSGYLVFAWQNLTYVVNNSEAGFALMPEVLYRRGQVRFRQGMLAEAAKDLEDALQGDPNHVRASYELSQVAVALGDRARARTVLEKALERAPESRLLKLALSDLQARAKK